MDCTPQYYSFPITSPYNENSVEYSPGQAAQPRLAQRRGRGNGWFVPGGRVTDGGCGS